jgi:hypothetical protein
MDHECEYRMTPLHLSPFASPDEGGLRFQCCFNVMPRAVATAHVQGRRRYCHSVLMIQAGLGDPHTLHHQVLDVPTNLVVDVQVLYRVLHSK